MLLCGYSRPLLARETGWLTVLAAVLLLVAPVAADAQPPATPVIGFLGTSTAAAWAGYVAGFRQGLGEAGYVDGRNATIEFRWAEDRPDRVSALAADLVGRPVSVIVTSARTSLPSAAGGPGDRVLRCRGHTFEGSASG